MRGSVLGGADTSMPDRRYMEPPQFVITFAQGKDVRGVFVLNILYKLWYIFVSSEQPGRNQDHASEEAQGRICAEPRT